MFEMLKGLRQVASLMGNQSKLKEEVEKLQQRIGQIIAEGDAGAGMVKVKVNGRFEVQGCTISEEAMKLNDREMLEDLLKAATNQALAKARDLVAEENGKMAANLGLPIGPGGLNLPGMS
jgi:DNA-binding YbaB/EbfC family protein